MTIAAHTKAELEFLELMKSSLPNIIKARIDEQNQANLPEPSGWIVYGEQCNHLYLDAKDALGETTHALYTRPLPVYFMKIKDVLARTGLKVDNLYLQIRLGNFPKPVKVTTQSSVWVSTEIDKWMTKKIAELR
jgi:prophage regulatory protein